MIERVEVPLTNGETVFVTPPGFMVIRAIVEKVAGLHPLPDPTTFEMAVEDSFIPGDTLPAESNPAYQLAKQRTDRLRSNEQQYIFLGIGVDTIDSREVVTKRYAPELSKLRPYVELPADDYVAILCAFYITTSKDLLTILNVINKRLPLTAGEVIDGIRTFRLDLSGQANGSNHSPQRSSDIQRYEHVQAQHAIG